MIDPHGNQVASCQLKEGLIQYFYDQMSGCESVCRRSREQMVIQKGHLLMIELDAGSSEKAWTDSGGYSKMPVAACGESRSDSDMNESNGVAQDQRYI